MNTHPSLIFPKIVEKGLQPAFSPICVPMPDQLRPPGSVTG
jgi:hypothetical protein